MDRASVRSLRSFFLFFFPPDVQELNLASRDGSAVAAFTFGEEQMSVPWRASGGTDHRYPLSAEGAGVSKGGHNLSHVSTPFKTEVSVRSES